MQPLFVHFYIIRNLIQNSSVYFRSGDFNPEGAPRSARLTTIRDDGLKAFVEVNRSQTVHELAEGLEVSKTAIQDGLRPLGKVKSSTSGCAVERSREIVASRNLFFIASLVSKRSVF